MAQFDMGNGGFISGGAWTPTSASNFPDPFMDMASLAMPETMTYALRWCEYLMFAQGTYFRALDRVLSYFITDIEMTDIKDADEKEKISNYLHNPDGIDLLDDIHTAGLNYMVYGNDFSSIIMPFRRYLSCPKCRLELPLKTVVSTNEFKFKWENFDFNAACPKCKYSGVWDHIDRRSGEAGPVKVKHWSPHEIELLWDPYTDDTSYIWKIPEDYRKMIREGKLYHLERANWELIQCVKNNTHLRFDDDVIYHMKENTLAGVRNRGWGVSRVLSNFRQAWYVQVLHRYNEAIALDYVIPFRLITPAPGPGSQDQARDVLLNMNAGGYMSQIQRMLMKRRRDPASWHTLPFPVQYQALGGDATQLAPRELLDQGLEVLLNNVGVPVELYKGSLQIQSAPAALRLFESSWSHLMHNLNGYIGFVMKRLGQLLNWEKASAKLQRVTHADDLQRQMAKLQLMMGGQVSKQTGLAWASTTGTRQSGRWRNNSSRPSSRTSCKKHSNKRPRCRRWDNSHSSPAEALRLLQAVETHLKAVVRLHRAVETLRRVVECHRARPTSWLVNQLSRTNLLRRKRCLQKHNSLHNRFCPCQRLRRTAS